MNMELSRFYHCNLFIAARTIRFPSISSASSCQLASRSHLITRTQTVTRTSADRRSSPKCSFRVANYLRVSSGRRDRRPGAVAETANHPVADRRLDRPSTKRSGWNGRGRFSAARQTLRPFLPCRRTSSPASPTDPGADRASPFRPWLAFEAQVYADQRGKEYGLYVPNPTRDHSFVERDPQEKARHRIALVPCNTTPISPQPARRSVPFPTRTEPAQWHGPNPTRRQKWRHGLRQ